MDIQYAAAHTHHIVAEPDIAHFARLPDSLQRTEAGNRAADIPVGTTDTAADIDLVYTAVGKVVDRAADTVAGTTYFVRMSQKLSQRILLYQSNLI